MASFRDQHSYSHKDRRKMNEHEINGGVVNLYKNQGNLHIHDSGKKEIQIKREKIYTNSDGCRDIHFGK